MSVSTLLNVSVHFSLIPWFPFRGIPYPACPQLAGGSAPACGCSRGGLGRLTARWARGGWRIPGWVSERRKQLGSVARPQKSWLGVCSGLEQCLRTNSCGSCGRNATLKFNFFSRKIKHAIFHGLGKPWDWYFCLPWCVILFCNNIPFVAI